MAAALRATLNAGSADALAAVPAGVNLVADSVVLFANPRSARASRHVLAHARAQAEQQGAHYAELRDWPRLYSMLDEWRAQDHRQLWVLAGDGTVRAILQYARDHGWHPQLLVLAAGRSNTIAREFGARNVAHVLDAAFARRAHGAPLRVERRCLLEVVPQRGAEAKVGFFFAAALVEAAIRLCAEHREAATGWLHTGVLSSQYRLAKLGLEMMMGKNPLPLQPRMRIETEQGALDGILRALVATTLRQRGLFSPFREAGRGAIRLTAVSQEAAHFWPRLPRMLAGRFSQAMEPAAGYLSGRFERVTLSGISRYSLDGDLFEVDASSSLELRCGPWVEFLTL